MPNWVSNELTWEFQGVKEGESYQEFNIMDFTTEDDEKSPQLDFEKIIPRTDENTKGYWTPIEKEHMHQDILTKEIEGVMCSFNWYDWNVKYWGTKWNSSSSIINKCNNEAYFATAWNCPEQIVKALSEGLYMATKNRA